MEKVQLNLFILMSGEMAPASSDSFSPTMTSIDSSVATVEKSAVLSPTFDEVGVVAALSELHHGVDQVGHVGLAGSFSQEGEVLLQDGSVVFLLDVGELHLDDGLLLGGQLLLHVLFQSAEHHGLQDSLQLLHLRQSTQQQ